MASSEVDRLVHTEEEQRALDELLEEMNKHYLQLGQLCGKPLTLEDRIEALKESIRGPRPD